MNQLLLSLKLHKDTPLALLLLFSGFFILGFGIIAIILAVDETAVSWVQLGTIMAAVGIVLFAVISFLGYHQDFMLALSMGRTRKEFMVSYAAEQFIWIGVAYLGLLLTAWLESQIYTVLFPDAFEEFSLLPFLCNWKLILPVLIVLVIVPMFFGALYSKYGKRFGVILYFVWLGSCLILPRVINHFTELDNDTQQNILSVFGWILYIPPVGWICIGIAALIAMVITTIHLGMKQMVK